MMHKSSSPALKWVHLLTGLIVAISAVLVGLIPLGYDFFGYLSSSDLAWVVTPLSIIIGICGVIVLLMSIAHMTNMCDCHEGRGSR